MKNSFLIILFIMALITSCQRSKKVLHSVAEITFADSIPICDIGIPAIKGSEFLLMNNTWILKEYKIKNGVFPIPSEDLHVAGEYTFSFLDHNHNVIATAHSYVKSAEPNSKIETYLTYPYITAGTNELSETVVIPIDIYGNMLDRNVDVWINFQSENTTVAEITNSLFNYSTSKLYSQNQAMQIPYSLGTNYTFSQNYTLKIEPNHPTNMTTRVHRKTKYSDAQQSILIEGMDIKDAYGNTCLDGTNITFVVKDEQHTSQFESIVISGKCQSEFIAPVTSSSLEIYAIRNGKPLGNIVNLNFDPVAVRCNVITFKSSIEFSFISPNMGQAIEDGTVVHLQIFNDTDTLNIKKQSEHGKIHVDRSQYGLDSGNYEFISEVYGKQYKGKIKL